MLGAYASGNSRTLGKVQAAQPVDGSSISRLTDDEKLRQVFGRFPFRRFLRGVLSSRSKSSRSFLAFD